MTQFVIDQGDDEILDLTLLQSDGTTPLNLTGAKLWFVVKASVEDADGDAVLTKTSDPGEGITITAPATSGLAEVVIDRADTEGLAASFLSRPLYWAVQALDGGGKISTLAKGTLVIVPDFIAATA